MRLASGEGPSAEERTGARKDGEGASENATPTNIPVPILHLTHIVHIVYKYDMRKIFANRARLLVYVEAWEAEAVEKVARRNGQTVQEWLREVVRAGLGDENDSGSAEKDMPGVGAVSAAERGAGAVRGRKESAPRVAAENCMHGYGPGECPKPLCGNHRGGRA